MFFMNSAVSLEILNRILFGEKKNMYYYLSFEAEVMPRKSLLLLTVFDIFSWGVSTGITVVLKISLMIQCPLEGTHKIYLIYLFDYSIQSIANLNNAWILNQSHKLCVQIPLACTHRFCYISVLQWCLSMIPRKDSQSQVFN